MHRTQAVALVVAIILASACSKSENANRGADTVAGAAPAAVSTGDTGMAGMDHSKMTMDSAGGMQAMQGMQMTGDPDRDFLRMMSDHHKGLIAMAHDAVEGGKAQASKSDAQKLDKKQDTELQQMQDRLEKQYKDQYQPKVMPDNQQMVDDLKSKSAGKEYDRAFYEHTIMHHQQAVKMIDEYLPKGKDAQVKAMAEKMKSDQQKEIGEFQKKVSSL